MPGMALGRPIMYRKNNQLNSGGKWMMNTNFAKNLTKAMAQYGEMLNRFGA